MAGFLPYDTNQLIKVVRNLKTAQTFLLDRFFPYVINSDTEYVSIDVDIGKRRMAPFVSPLVQGKLVEQRTIQTNTFKPAYIKDKRAPDLRRPVRRMIGERIGGDMTSEERMMANLESELTDQIDILTRRLEWMAAQAMCYGTVTVVGEGFPAVLIDFGRDPSLTVNLTGTAQWGVPANLNASGQDPVPTADIELWQHNILKVSGARVEDIIFTTTPWQKFLNAVGVFGAIYYPKLAEAGNVIDPGARIERGALFKGVWGQYRLWVYNDWYVDDNNVEQMMVPDGTILLCGPDMEGVRAFGQIIDPKFNYEALSFAPKTWIEEDPAQQMLMMQSAPLVIPSRVSACLAANVCAGVVT